MLFKTFKRSLDHNAEMLQGQPEDSTLDMLVLALLFGIALRSYAQHVDDPQGFTDHVLEMVQRTQTGDLDHIYEEIRSH